jgi:importin subunit beta-1
MRVHYGFTSAAAPEVVPTLLLLMTKQDDDATDEEYNISRAAYQCLQLYSQCIGRNIMQFVVPFVQNSIENSDWHQREAAVSALGAIMEGPDEETLPPMVKDALPVILQKMQDDNIHVRDSAAFTIGRICEIIPTAIDPDTQLPTLIDALFTGLSHNPRLATSCCWALMSIADNFCGDPGCQTNALSPHFKNAVTAILSLTEKPEANGQLRVAAYEVLNTFVTNSAHDNVEAVAELSNVILTRLEGTVPMQSQIVSVEDRMTLEEIQTSLASCLLAIIQRLEGQIKPQADRIMNILLQLLSSATAKSSVPDAILATIGALATCLDQDFEKYMDSFVPFLHNALANHEEPAICSMAIGLVSDIVRALEEKSQRFCDQFMNHLLTDLQSPLLGNQFKPAILQCFGDIAHAIGPHFKTYLSIVGQILQQAAKVQIGSDNGFEMVEYVVSLREGIMDAWSGIIFAMKQGESQALVPYVESIFTLLGMIASDHNRTEGLLRSSMGVIG